MSKTNITETAEAMPVNRQSGKSRKCYETHTNCVDQCLHEDRAKQHTPGPWKADKWAGDAWTVCAPYSHYSVCHLVGCNNAEANARLMASAPDLLEALKAAEIYVATLNAAMFTRSQQFRVAKQVRAAIAHAEGE